MSRTVVVFVADHTNTNNEVETVMKQVESTKQAWSTCLFYPATTTKMQILDMFEWFEKGRIYAFPYVPVPMERDTHINKTMHYFCKRHSITTMIFFPFLCSVRYQKVDIAQDTLLNNIGTEGAYRYGQMLHNEHWVVPPISGVHKIGSYLCEWTYEKLAVLPEEKKVATAAYVFDEPDLVPCKAKIEEKPTQQSAPPPPPPPPITYSEWKNITEQDWVQQKWNVLQRHLTQVESEVKSKGKNPDKFLWFYLAADALRNLNEHSQAVRYYKRAIAMDPECVQPYYWIAYICRTKSPPDHQESYLYATAGLKLLPDVTNTKTRFYYHDVAHTYGLWEEVSIVSWYIPNVLRTIESVEACDQLSLRRGVPGFNQHQARLNMCCYVRPFPNQQQVQITGAKLPGGWHPCNPSLHYNEPKKQYEFILRTVNYQIRQNGSYDIPPPGTVLTRNYWLTMDHAFQITSQKELTTDMQMPADADHGIQGMEDCRLLFKEDVSLISCTCAELMNPRCPQIILVKTGTLPITKYWHLTGMPMGCQKNWLPFWFNGMAHWVYSTSPLTVIKVDQDKLPEDKSQVEVTVVSKTPVPKDREFGYFCGSASPLHVPEKKGFLFVIHEALQARGESKRTYVHRFAWMNEEFKLTAITSPWIFKERHIEYCAGMSRSHEPGKVVLTYGVEDHEAWFTTIPLETIYNKLVPLIYT